MKQILNHLAAYKSLNRNEAKQILTDISVGKYNAAQIAAFLTTYMMRSIQVEELNGFCDALLELCVPVTLEEPAIIDVCGTGGDGKDTFNISTLASFVIAGAGHKVAKHGNYGVSSISGSSNVLEYLGYKFTNDVDALKRSLSGSNICFMHAPLFHPALKNVAPIRKELAVKTFFNMLGPMVNPAQPTHQMVGVYSLELARTYNYIYQQKNKKYQIIHAYAGYDEISLTSPFKVYDNMGEHIFEASDLNLPQLSEADLFGGNSIEASAKIFLSVLQNEATLAQTNAVIANAAFGIKCFEENKTILECIEIARQSIVSGAALRSFKKMIES